MKRISQHDLPTHRFTMFEFMLYAMLNNVINKSIRFKNESEFAYPNDKEWKSGIIYDLTLYSHDGYGISTFGIGIKINDKINGYELSHSFVIELLD